MIASNVALMMAVLAAAAAGLDRTADLHAQTFPSRPITIIVPSAAGGGTDTLARLVGDQLSKQIGQSVVVENRTGGGMLVGTARWRRRRPTATRCSPA